ncbi:unnamed protein product [Bathycoccus prasinos]
MDTNNNTKKKNKRRIVIKVGTSSLIKADTGVIHLSQLAKICEQITELQKSSEFQCAIVTSGAVGAGMLQLGIKEKPKELQKRQALAAIGQAHLMHYYEDMFATLGVKTAQVLLTLENLSQKSQYSRAMNTFSSLFDYDVVPIVNENDTVAVEELRFGDNDTLSAHVASLISAEYLFLFTDVDGLYTSNPMKDPNAKRIQVVDDINKLMSEVDVASGAGSAGGTGGMVTKLTAARIASAAGCKTVIGKSTDMEKIVECALGLNGGKGGGEVTPSLNSKEYTLFLAAADAAKGKKRWMLSVPVKDHVRVNKEGEEDIKSGEPLLVKNVLVSDSNGTKSSSSNGYKVQDCIIVEDEEGREIARAIVKLQRGGFGPS